MTPVYGITDEQIAVYLGRSLTATEVASFEAMLDVTAKRLGNMLCADIAFREGVARTFQAADGMRTVFTGFVSEISSIALNEVATTDYTLKQGDTQGELGWYDNIVFSKPLNRGDVVVVTGNFGFAEIPADLGLVLARLFELGGKEVKADGVKSKQVEDFRLTYSDAAVIDQFIAANAATLAAYSQCGGAKLRSGSVKGCLR